MYEYMFKALAGQIDIEIQARENMHADPEFLSMISESGHAALDAQMHLLKELQEYHKKLFAEMN